MISQQSKEKLRRIIFDDDTSAGRLFDIALLWVIVISVMAVILGSVASIQVRFRTLLAVIEWTVTVLFTAEYVLRLICVENRRAYAKSFFGIVDLLAFLPAYFTLFVPWAHSFVVIRALRLLRIFRILKLARFMSQADIILKALYESRYKISVFLVGVLTAVLILGSMMYMIEGEQSGFNNIPQSMYWAVVTMTTVGYGDIAPVTVLGKMIASILMLMGYAVIAVPTGIVSVEMMQAAKESGRVCEKCKTGDHQHDAVFCRRCGEKLLSNE